jgi:hypothetical protein
VYVATHRIVEKLHQLGQNLIFDFILILILDLISAAYPN